MAYPMHTAAACVFLMLLSGYVWRRLSARCADARLRRDALLVGRDQLPRLHACLLACGVKLGIAAPACWVLPSGAEPGRLRFLRRDRLVLDAGLLDTLYDDDDALAFHLGHELAHALQRRQDSRWRCLAAVTPLRGHARARDRQFARDRSGAQCCSSRAAALRALVLLGAGRGVGKDIAVDMLAARDDGGFLASLLALTADRPSLVMRVERLRGEGVTKARAPHRLAWLLAACVPRLGLRGGLLAGGALIAGTALAVLPAYAEYAGKARLADHLARAYATAREAARHVERFVAAQEQLPVSVQQAGFELPPDGAVRAIAIAQAGGAMTVRLDAPYAGLTLYLVPGMDSAGALSWRCTPGPDIAPAVLPAACRGADANRL
jgi:hypothetical protein